jgi:hypothetical protein
VVGGFESGGDGVDKLFWGDGFAEDREGVCVMSVASDIVAGIGGDEDTGAYAIKLFEGFDGFDAGEDVHVHIEEDDIDALAGDDFESVFSGFGFVEVEKGAIFEDFSEHSAEGRVIVGDQQVVGFGFGLHHGGV